MLHQGTRRILVIEHDVWRRADLVARLADAGYQVRHASNGFSGLRLARDAAPDVIMLGGALPDLASALVREELQEDPRTRSVPVIALGDGGRNTACLLATELCQVMGARSA